MIAYSVNVGRVGECVEAAGACAPFKALPREFHPHLSTFAGETLSQVKRPARSGARIVIASQRGAEARACQTASACGFPARDCPVGETGKPVAPERYAAAGIAQARRSKAGMKGAKRLTAVNDGREAAVFQPADIGLAVDLFQVLPELDAEQARRGHN